MGARPGPARAGAASTGQNPLGLFGLPLGTVRPFTVLPRFYPGEWGARSCYADKCVYEWQQFYSHSTQIYADDFTRVQMKLVDKVIALKRNFLVKSGYSINRRYMLHEFMKNNLTAIQTYLKHYVMQG